MGANILPAGTRVRLEDPDYGPWFGCVVLCLCKRHVWQQELPGGAGPGRGCGYAQCGYPRSAEACPWPMHVRWDGGDNESHQGMEGLTVLAG